MSSLNQCQIVGRLGRDADSDVGKKHARFSVATSKYKKEDNGQFTETTTWHDIVCFGFLVDKALTLKKGDMVALAGEISKRSYKDRDGNDRVAVNIVAHVLNKMPSLRSLEPEQPWSSDEPKINEVPF